MPRTIRATRRSRSGGFTFSPRRVLRPHRVAHRQPRAQRRHVPARAAARRRLGLLLRHGQLRRRLRHGEPLRHRRHVRRPLQRRVPQGRARPRRELRHADCIRDDVQGDARRLDERRLRPVRQPGRDRQAVRRQGRQQHRGRHPPPRRGGPHGRRARATSRSAPTRTATRSTACSPTSPQDEPEVEAEPGFEGEVAAFNLFAYLVALRRHLEPVGREQSARTACTARRPRSTSCRSSTATTASSGSCSCPTRSSGTSRTATPARCARKVVMKAGDVAAMPARHPPPGLLAQALDAARVGERLGRPARADRDGAALRSTRSTSEVSRASIVSLDEAVEAHIHDGDTVAFEGFTHLIPHAAGHEVIRQGRRDLTLVRMTPDVVYDQLIGAGLREEDWSSRGAATPASGRCTGSATPSSTAGRTRSRSKSTATPAWRLGTWPARRDCRSACSGATSAPTSSDHTPTIAPITCPFTGETAHRGAGASSPTSP